LTLYQGPVGVEAARYTDAGFLMHALGFLHGMRCQFYDWWIDGRYFPATDTDYVTPRIELVAQAITRMYRQWRSWGPKPQLTTINALFLHSRT